MGKAIESRPLKLDWSSALWLASILSVLVAIGWRVLENAPSSPLNNTFAVFLIFFALIFTGVMYRSIARKRIDNKFDATPLVLDPLEPGVGGHMGGRFRLSSQHADLAIDDDTTFYATLSCSTIRALGSEKTFSTDWSNQVPVHLNVTVDGVEGMFLIDIQDHCSPSEDWALSIKIHWHVTVEGEFQTNGLGKFSRTWDVSAGEKACRTAMPIPTSFLQKTKKQSRDNARNSVLDEFLVSENDQYIHLHSRAGKEVIFKIVMMLFGSVFVAGGLFSEESGLTRFLFLLIGVVPGLYSAYSIGKSLRVVIDKHTRLVSTQQRWMGIAYSNKTGLLKPVDLSIQPTGNNHIGNRPINYYNSMER